MSTEPAAVEQTPSDDDAMGAIYDKLTAEPVEAEAVDEEPQQEDAKDGKEGLRQDEEEVTEPAEDEAKAEDEAEEPAEKPVEAPTDLPAPIRAKWQDMPPEAREAVLSSHRDLTRKMADQGRIVQASKPVYDVLVKAAQEIPTLSDMTPQQIAADVFAMAQIQGQLAQDPVRTLMGIAKQYGALEGIKAAISGQGQSEAARENVSLMQEIRQLRAQLQNVADPNAIEQRVNSTLTTRETERMVSEYAAQKEYWSDVEPVIPQMIPIAQQRLGEGASAKDVLDAAYDMAIHAIPDLRAKAVAAVPTPAQHDPARTAAQLKAKSVNVKSSSPTKPRPQSEVDRMAAIWDKYHN